MLKFLFFSPPPVPTSRVREPDLRSTLPHVVKSEIAQLSNKFTMDYANEGEDERNEDILVCSISELLVFLC